MRNLSECKNYFKDLFFNCLDENGLKKVRLTVQNGRNMRLLQTL